MTRPSIPQAALAAAMLALAAPQAGAQISDDVVRIGIMGDMAGPYAGNGGPGSVLAARMAIEDFGGKVTGKPVELLIVDDQNKPDVGLNAARKWLDVDKVDAIVGGSASSIALGVQTLMKEKQKPYLVAGTVTISTGIVVTASTRVVSINPTDAMVTVRAGMNGAAFEKALADARDDLAYIDIVPAMLKPDGTPKDIFVEDNLHMTPAGYALWTPIVDAALDAGQPAKAPGC